MSRSRRAELAPPPALIERLKARHGEPHRHYHDWGHVERLLTLFDRFHGAMQHPRVLLYALYWHDAVYDPTAHDNEERSAALLREEAADLLSADELDLAETMILASQDHRVPEGLSPGAEADLKLFLDFDLSHFAAPPDAFAVRNAAIRREYAWVPEVDYRRARAAVLGGFLARERIYLTPACHDAWEAKARANLQRAVADLQGSGTA